MLDDVLTWLHKCKLNVKIIIVHGVLMFHMYGHIASSQVWVHGTVIHHSW